VRSLRVWAGFAIAALSLTLLVSVVSTFAYLQRASLIDKFTADQGSVTDDQLTSSDNLIKACALAALAVFVFTAFSFIGWLAAGARCAEEIRPDALRHSRGWAVGAWFVPFLNLRRPPKIVYDVWLSTSPRGGRHSAPLIGWWWGVLLASGFVGRGAASDTKTLSGLHSQAVAEVALSPLHLAAAVLAILVVQKTTRRLTGFAGFPEYTGYSETPGGLAPRHPAWLPDEPEPPKPGDPAQPQGSWELPT
jgi:hypothetical protein